MTRKAMADGLRGLANALQHGGLSEEEFETRLERLMSAWAARVAPVEEVDEQEKDDGDGR